MRRVAPAGAAPASVVWLRAFVRQTSCFWRWPPGHYWVSAGGYSEECERCGAWRKWW